MIKQIQLINLVLLMDITLQLLCHFKINNNTCRNYLKIFSFYFKNELNYLINNHYKITIQILFIRM